MNKQILNLSFLIVLLSLFLVSQVMGSQRTIAKSKSVKNNTCSIKKINTNKSSLQSKLCN